MIAGVIAAVLGGCGGSVRPVKARRVAASISPVPTVTATGKPTTTAGPATPPASPALLALGRTLSSALNAAGPSTGALVYDIDARQTLFASRAGVMRPPASVEKIYTTVAVLNTLGSGARLRTTILGTGHLGPGGVWHGNLYLRGGGDPTFGDGGFNRVWENGYGPTATQLVRELSAKGIRRVTGSLIADASLFDSRRGGPATRYAPDIPDFGGQLSALTYDHGSTMRRMSPGAFAAKEVALTMRDLHIAAKAARLTAVTPPGARRLASVNSPPMSVLLRLMDVPSDDFFAEMLTKQLGVHFDNVGSIQAGARVISTMIGSYGVQPRIVDGSGLSRSDRSSPAQVVGLLRSVWGTPTGRLLDDSLPTVGVNGTVQGVAARTAAQGRCIAKTGTLNNVTNLAGYCHSLGGHVLAFALLLDGPSNGAAIPLISKMVAAIAKY